MHADHKDIAFVDHAVFRKSGSVVVVVCADVVRFRGIRVAEAAEEVLADAVVVTDAVPAAAGPCRLGLLTFRVLRIARKRH